MLDHVIQERNAYRGIIVQAREQAVKEVLENARKNEEAHAKATDGVVIETPGADDQGIHGAND